MVLRRAALLVVLSLLAAPLRADLPELKAAGRLRVLAVEGSPQFVALAAGAPPGFERELLESFGQLHKVAVEIVPVAGWDALIPALAEGQGDVAASGITITPARQKLVDFTAETFPTRLVVLTRKPHRVVGSVEELRREKVGTIRGTSMADALEAARVPPAAIDDGFASGALPRGLRSGRVTAVVIGVEDAVLESRLDPQLQLGAFVGAPGSLALAVRKDHPQLRDALSAFLANARRSGAWNRLVVKYFGDAAVDVLRRAQER